MTGSMGELCIPSISQLSPRYPHPTRPNRYNTWKAGKYGELQHIKKTSWFYTFKNWYLGGPFFFSISFCSNLRPSALARAQSSRLLRIMSRRTLSGREVQTSVRPGYLADLAFEMGMGQVSSLKTIENWHGSPIWWGVDDFFPNA